MSNQIILKKSSVTGKVPQTYDLEYGEVALNYADGKLYFKDSNNSISNIGKNADTANSLQTPRLISISGAIIGYGVYFDGSSNIEIQTTPSTNLITTYSISAELAVGGVDLRLTGSDTTNDNVSMVGGAGITVERIDANTISINSLSPTSTDFIDLTDTVLNTIDSFNKNVYRTAKYLVQAVNGTEVHCTEVLITHNNTDVFITEYATMYSGNSLMTISASIDATTVYLEATADYNNTNIDFVRTTISRISGLEGDLMLQSGTEDLMLGSGTVDLDV
jgi:hypothetical protein